MCHPGHLLFKTPTGVAVSMIVVAESVVTGCIAQPIPQQARVTGAAGQAGLCDRRHCQAAALVIGAEKNIPKACST